MFNKKTSFAAVLAILCLTTSLKLLYIDHIVTRPLNDYDEARYAEVAKNMLRTNSFLVPLAGGPDEPRSLPYTHLQNGEQLYPFFWKPPLTMWLQALSMQAIGVNEFASRLPSFLASLGLVVIICMLFNEMRIQPKTYFPLLLIFLFTFDFPYIATQGTTDALLAFFGALVVLLAYKKKHDISCCCRDNCWSRIPNKIYSSTLDTKHVLAEPFSFKKIHHKKSFRVLVYVSFYCRSMVYFYVRNIW
ncbi:MAG: Undecaprenyl phosphate-alpha-4-amino-4-deoxy-L-arabinose arabinosyl transferase [Microgenomates bacterium OLB23]|nr:MAG: Undecaprenyl phosphate-alpha-4-amino-4-deoxy-L-arabinose arabinosyl transferase [Microgenomates bacterium OLB23]